MNHIMVRKTIVWRQEWISRGGRGWEMGKLGGGANRDRRKREEGGGRWEGGLDRERGKGQEGVGDGGGHTGQGGGG